MPTDSPKPCLIFLLSLPRAGSTLLQRLLLASGKCETLGEASLLLRLLGDEDEVIQRRATYWESLVDAARSDMRAAWPGFDEAYRAGVRDLIERVYGGLAGGTGCFLDKTPRYSLIAEQIHEVFPDAKFIVLWRHPLAVAASLSSTYRKGAWCPEEFGIDLDEGFKRLRHFTESHRDSVFEVRYEDLLDSPKETLDRLGHYLGWHGLARVLETDLPKSTGGRLGDSTGVERFQQLDPSNATAWISSVDNWYRRRWCRRYWQADPARAKWLEDEGYALPSEFSRFSSSPISLLRGIGDYISSRVRVRRRITRPTWLPRFARKFAKKHGFGVLFR